MLKKEPLSSKILYERVYAYRAPTISSEFEFLESHPRSKRSRYGILHRNSPAAVFVPGDLRRSGIGTCGIFLRSHTPVLVDLRLRVALFP